MAKRKRNRLALLLPLLAVGLLVALSVLFSPRAAAPEQSSLGTVSMESDSMSAGRHYDWIRLDSMMGLVRKIDPQAEKVAMEMKNDSLVLKRKPSFSAARFRRIFQNQRTAKDFRRLEALPIRMLPGEASGYVAEVMREGDIAYIKLPFEMLAGMMAEWGKTKGKTATE